MKTAIVEPSTKRDLAEPLKVDSLAPYFSGIDQYGEFQSLDRLQSKGPFAIIFYRGHWCYFCRRHIIQFQKGLDQLTDEGFPVILVTPEKPQYISETLEKTNVKFPILHDNLNYIMNNYKVSRSVSKTTRAPFTKVDLTKVNGAIDPVLPVPATYIVGTDGIIKYAHFNLNYALRSSFKTVAKTVKEIRATARH